MRAHFRVSSGPLYRITLLRVAQKVADSASGASILPGNSRNGPFLAGEGQDDRLFFRSEFFASRHDQTEKLIALSNSLGLPYATSMIAVPVAALWAAAQIKRRGRHIVIAHPEQTLFALKPNSLGAALRCFAGMLYTRGTDSEGRVVVAGAAVVALRRVLGGVI